MSAPAGITDVLLGLATRAVAGEKSGRIGRDVAALRARYHAIARAAHRCSKGGRRRAALAAEIDRSLDELARLLSSLAALKELTAAHARLRGQPRRAAVGADLRGGDGRGRDRRRRYVDATEIVFTDGPFGGASPNLALTDLAARKKLQPLIAAGKVPVVPGFIGSARIEDDSGSATGSARWPRSGAAAPT